MTEGTKTNSGAFIDSEMLTGWISWFKAEDYVPSRLPLTLPASI